MDEGLSVIYFLFPILNSFTLNLSQECSWLNHGTEAVRNRAWNFFMRKRSTTHSILIYSATMGRFYFSLSLESLNILWKVLFTKISLPQASTPYPSLASSSEVRLSRPVKEKFALNLILMFSFIGEWWVTFISLVWPKEMLKLWQACKLLKDVLKMVNSIIFFSLHHFFQPNLSHKLFLYTEKNIMYNQYE